MEIDRTPLAQYGHEEKSIPQNGLADARLINQGGLLRFGTRPRRENRRQSQDALEAPGCRIRPHG